MLIVNPSLANNIYQGLPNPNNIFSHSVAQISHLLLNTTKSEYEITQKFESFVKSNYPLLNRQSNLPYDSKLSIIVPNIFKQFSDELIVSNPVEKTVSLYNLLSDMRNNYSIAAFIKFTNGELGFAIVKHFTSTRSTKRFALALYLNDRSVKSASHIKHWQTAEIIYLHLVQSNLSNRYHERFDVREQLTYTTDTLRHLVKRYYYANEFECDICLDPKICPGAVYIQYMESNNIDYCDESVISLPESYKVKVPQEFIKHEPVNIIKSAPIGLTTIDKKRQNRLDKKIRSAWKLSKEAGLHEFLENYSDAAHKYTVDPDSFTKLMRNYEAKFDSTESLYHFIKTGKNNSEDDKWMELDMSIAFKLTKTNDIKQLKRKLPRKTEKSEEQDKIKVRIITRKPSGKQDRIIAVYNSIIHNSFFNGDPDLQIVLARAIVENRKKECFNIMFDLLINRFGGYDKINKRLNKLIENSSVFMAAHSRTLTALLDDPEHEIKSGVEVGQGSGADPMGSQRLQIEILRMQSDLHNYNSLKKYGFISTKNYPLVDSRIKQYGTIILEFHDYIKERTTITFGDSFGAFTQPVDMLDPDIKLLITGLFHESYYGRETSLFNFIRALDTMYECLKNLMKRSMLRQGLNIAGVLNSGYVEAQITDKLTLEDVKTIYVQTDKITQVYRDAVINPDKVPPHLHFALYNSRDNCSSKKYASLYSYIKTRRPVLKN